MSDTSREAFEAWCERTCHFSSANNDWARIAWSARDAEVEGLKARVEELLGRLKKAEAKLSRLGYERECNIPACNCDDRWTHKRAEI